MKTNPRNLHISWISVVLTSLSNGIYSNYDIGIVSAT